MAAQSYRGAIRPPRTVYPSPSTGPGLPEGPNPLRFPGKAGQVTVPDAVFARYQKEQAAVGDQTAHVVGYLWGQHMDPNNFGSSWNDLAPMIKSIIERHYRASAASAVSFYRRIHVAEKHGVAAVSPAPLDAGRLARMAGSMSNGTFRHQLNKQQRDPADAARIAGNTLSGASSRFALMGGRNTVIQAVATDPSAIGWERVLDDNPCSFCTMHAANGPYTPDMTDFHPHDNCNCVARPLFRGQIPVNAELGTKWRKVTKGKSGKDARMAWEQFGRMNNDGNNGNTTTRDSLGPASASESG